MDDFLTVKQAAARRDVAEATLYKAIREGRIPFERILDRYILRPADVDAWEPASWGGVRRAGKGRRGAHNRKAEGA